MTLGFALVSALVYLAWLLDRTVLLWPAFALALAFASGLSLSGHDAVDPGSSWKTQARRLGAPLGGLALGRRAVALVAVVWRLAPALRREAFVRFSRLAVGLVGLVLAAGIYLAIVRLPALSDLWTARRTGRCCS